LEQAEREALRRSPELQRLCSQLHGRASEPRFLYATDLHREQKSDEMQTVR